MIFKKILSYLKNFLTDISKIIISQYKNIVIDYEIEKSKAYFERNGIINSIRIVNIDRSILFISKICVKYIRNYLKINKDLIAEEEKNYDEYYIQVFVFVCFTSEEGWRAEKYKLLDYKLSTKKYNLKILEEKLLENIVSFFEKYNIEKIEFIEIQLI